VTYSVTLGIKHPGAHPEDPMPPAITLAYSRNESAESRNSKLLSIKPTMLQCNSSASPPLVGKAARLLKARPDLAAVIERLVDDLLDEL